MIELDKTEEKPEINPSYEALGLPSDKDYAIYYAGESYDEESIILLTIPISLVLE